MLSLKDKILAVLAAIGTAIIAIWAYRSGKDKAESDAMDDALNGLEKVVERSEHDADASAKAHNEAVDQANAARKESDEQNKADVDHVRDAVAIGLRNGSDAINDAISRTNGGV
jgi:hypothetical protein